MAHVLLGLLELPLGLLAADAEAGDPRGLLEDGAPLLGLGGEELVDLALLHDGVGGLADPRVEEELAHVAELHRLVVDEVLALPRAVEPALDRHLGQVQGQDLVLVGHEEGDLGDVQGLAVSVPAKMTSSMFSARSDLEDCSPSTHFMASTTLLLPHPLGPRRAATPSVNSICTLSAKDLNPKISRLFKKHFRSQLTFATMRSVSLTPEWRGWSSGDEQSQRMPPDHGSRVSASPGLRHRRGGPRPHRRAR